MRECTRYAALALLLTLLATTGCRDESYERDVRAALLQTERTGRGAAGAKADTEWDDTTAVSLSRKDLLLHILLKNRTCPAENIDVKEVGMVISHFVEKGDSLIAAAAYLCQGEYWAYSGDIMKALWNLKNAEVWSPAAAPEIRAHALLSLSKLYHIDIPNRKTALLHEAERLYRKADNPRGLSECYRELMMSAADDDTARIYAQQASDLIPETDTIRRIYFNAARAMRFCETLSGDSIALLTEPLYRIAPNARHAYYLALGHIKEGDMESARQYVELVKESPETHHLWHKLMYEIYMKQGDRSRALEEYVKYDTEDENAFRKRAFENIESHENTMKERIVMRRLRMEETNSKFAIMATIIVVLTIAIIFLCIYFFLQRNNLRLRMENKARISAIETVRREMSAQLQKQQDTEALTDRLKEEKLTLLRDKILSQTGREDRYVVKTIDSFTQGAASRLLDAYPMLKERDVIIIFLRHAGCSGMEIAEFFGHKDTQTVNTRISRLKRDIMKDGDFDGWFSEEQCIHEE